MKTYLECIPCFLNQAVYMAQMGTADEKIKKMIIDDVAMAIPQFGLDDSPPEMARRIHQIIERHLGPQDFYKDIKYTSNIKALEIYPHLKAMVENASDRLLKAVEVAIVGNVIDYGAKNTLDIEKDVKRFLESDCLHAGKTIFDYEAFKDDLNRAETILYLGDNAGETVFDRVLIETVPSDKRIIFAVREKPVINDALIEDAVMSGIDKTAEIISSGVDAPGTILGLCSRVFNEVFTSADMVISKGQGNYETLTGADRQIYFLFRAKCPVIARHAGVPIGDLVLMKGGGNEHSDSL
jgi:uncharacterized protein with ATP-grasp and redox domains